MIKGDAILGFRRLLKKNWYKVIQILFAFLIYLFIATQDVSKLVRIISFCYLLLLVIIYGFNIYKNKVLFDYYKTDSYKEVIWKWSFKVTTLILLAFAIIILKDVFSPQWVTVCVDVVLLILAAIIELETLVCLMMVYFKRKFSYLLILSGILFIALLNNTHFINLIFGSVGILFVAQFVLSDNFLDYLKNYYSKYDMITIKKYMKANKTRFLAFSYLITFSGNVIFVIKHLLPSEFKDGLKSMILNFYNWVTGINIPSEFADLFLINAITWSAIILYYIYIDSLFKGKSKKTKAFILKHMRENLQEKKVGNSHG